MNNSFIAVLVVLFNSQKEIQRLFNSLAIQSYKNFKIYIIDNSTLSIDLNNFVGQFGDIKITPSQDNIGFAKANNILAKQSMIDGCNYVLILNPDMELEYNSIEKLVELAATENTIGVVSSVLLYGHGNNNRNKIQLYGGQINFLKQQKKFLYANENIENTILPTKLVVDFVNGGSMLVKRELLEKIDLFDEAFFMYNDETDFAYRVKIAGYKTMVTSETKIWHHHNWSKENNISHYMMYYYMMRNRILFFKKHKLYLNLIIDITHQLLTLPIKVKWLSAIADLTLVKYYYLGLWRGLKGETGKANIDFNK